MTTTEAYSRCSALARSHYENFPVGWLVPAQLQPHVHAIYAFARIADDFADEEYDSAEAPSQETRTRKLTEFGDQLQNALDGKPLDAEYEWVFLAVRDTLHKKDVPPRLLFDLLSAFRQDVVKPRYATHDEVLDYCRRSANPVGRIVLHLHGLHDEPLHLDSDHICTGLQLANFWQDVSVDLVKDRIYIPEEDQRAFGFDEKTLFEKEASLPFLKCMEFQVNRTWKLFEKGSALIPKLRTHSKRLAWEIRLTWLGGTTILKKIEMQNYNTLHHRPKLGKLDLLRLAPYAWLTC